MPDPISERLRAAFSPEAEQFLAIVARLAAQKGWEIYLVGGWVRDALLGIPNGDLDISVVGDAHALAHLIAQEVRGAVEAHDRFDTATVTVQKLPPAGRGPLMGNSALHLDLVTARSERYERPGALPAVEAGTILDDLARRDFTVNAMAARLTLEGPGDLVDPHGGLRDLDARLIRVLHSESFDDDPTRLIRAVRFAERLGFRIEQDTLELALQAIRDGALYTVSTDRAVRELLKVLEEPNAGAMLARLDKMGILQAIHPSLHWPYAPERLQIATDDSITREERRATYLASIGAEFAREPAEAGELAHALNFTAANRKLMHHAAKLAQLWPRLSDTDLSRSQVYSLLDPLDMDALEAYARIGVLSADMVAWNNLQDYLTNLRFIKPLLTGDYLRRIGLPPGAAYKRVLQALLQARLDGAVVTRDDEERFVRDWLKEEGLSPIE